jgi:predicted GNAT family acetyltransferase
MEYAIEHEESNAKGAFYVEKDLRRLAQMSYSRTNDTLIIIDHTEVDATLSGKGVGRRMLGELVQWARQTGTKVVPLCPFAKAQFAKDPSLRDVLV